MLDRAGEREEALEDSGAYTDGFASAAAFEVELGLEGLVDGLDDLAEGRIWPDRSPGAVSRSTIASAVSRSSVVALVSA